MIEEVKAGYGKKEMAEEVAEPTTEIESNETSEQEELAAELAKPEECSHLSTALKKRLTVKWYVLHKTDQ